MQITGDALKRSMWSNNKHTDSAITLKYLNSNLQLNTANYIVKEAITTGFIFYVARFMLT